MGWEAPEAHTRKGSKKTSHILEGTTALMDVDSYHQSCSSCLHNKPIQLSMGLL